MKGCPWPHRRLFVTVRGYATCPACYLSGDAIVDDMKFRLSPDEVWSHPGFEVLREKTQNEDWEWCKTCPLVPEGSVPCMFEPQQWPQEIHLCDSWGCNMKCLSCRDKMNVDGQSSQNERRARLFRLMEVFLPHATMLKMNGSGEVFMSPMHRELLWSLDKFKYPNLRLALITNGNLMPKYWPKMPNIHEMVDKIEISVDAATRQTYEYLRRGGSWDLVNEALQICSDLKKSGRLKSLYLRFTVNKRNIEEIGKFIEMGERYGASTVNFTVMERWPGANQEWHDENTLMNPQGLRQIREVVNSGVLDKPNVLALCLKHADKLYGGCSCL